MSKINDIKRELNRKEKHLKNEPFINKARLFLKDLYWGIDILNPGRQKYIGIEVGDDEFEIYEDNCVPIISEEKEVIRYKAKVEGSSAKKAQKRIRRLRSLDNYYTKMKEANSDGKQVTSIEVNEADSSLNEEPPNSPDQGSPARKKRRTSVHQQVLLLKDH